MPARGVASSGGADPCHVSLGSEEHVLYVANYTSGSLAVYELGENGALKNKRIFINIKEKEQILSVRNVPMCTLPGKGKAFFM
ncbi:MAG: lactonase family protein [Lachnospiraceae bacterium]|nr:lactonase family protein [Lachnospiraceae bacterium]